MVIARVGTILTAGILAACVAAQPPPGIDPSAKPRLAKSEIGVVLLHGKLGMPGSLGWLTSRLQYEGYRVVAPEMPWSRERVFDKTYDDSMDEIDSTGRRLMAEGAKLIVVAGHSLGGNAALRYAATRANASALVLMGPGFSPETPYFQSLLAGSIRDAERAVEAGRGDDRSRFFDITDDVNRPTQPILTNASTYLSFYGPKSNAVIPRNAAAVRSSLPVLWILASGDHNFYVRQGTSYGFESLPTHPLSRFVRIAASHSESPTAATAEVIEWIDRLRY